MSDLKALIEKSTEIETAVIEGGDDFMPEVNLSDPDSVEAYQFIAETLEHRAEFYKARAEEYAKYAKDISNVSDRYAAFIKKIMAEAGVSDVMGNSFRFKLSPAKAKMIIDDELSLKAAYSKVETKTVVDKERARQDLELGVPVPGARLEQNYSLRRYPIKVKESA